jgi:hypothetical protein
LFSISGNPNSSPALNPTHTMIGGAAPPTSGLEWLIIESDTQLSINNQSLPTLTQAQAAIWELVQKQQPVKELYLKAR